MQDDMLTLARQLWYRKNPILRRRTHLGLSRGDIAERVGAKESSVISWERGRYMPRNFYRMRAVAETLELPVVDLADDLAEWRREYERLAEHPGVYLSKELGLSVNLPPHHTRQTMSVDR